MGELEDSQLDQVLGLHGGAKAMKAMAMKAMKAMKEMKAMKAMKAMKKKKKAMKKYKKPALMAKRHAFAGKIMKTPSGLTKADLIKTKSGKIVSKKKSVKGKSNPWIAAVTAARKALG